MFFPALSRAWPARRIGPSWAKTAEFTKVIATRDAGSIRGIVVLREVFGSGIRAGHGHGAGRCQVFHGAVAGGAERSRNRRCVRSRQEWFDGERLAACSKADLLLRPMASRYGGSGSTPRA